MILKQLKEITCAKDKLKFLKENKKEVLAEKKHTIKHTDSIYSTPNRVATKAAGAGTNGVYRIVGNSCLFMDSHEDVSMPGSFNRTVNGGAQYAKFLKNHQHNTDGIIGRNTKVAIEQVPIRELNYEAEGSTECFVMYAQAIKEVDEKVFNAYKNGLIDQHSIGLQYVKIELAINDPEEKREFELWTKYVDNIINKEVALERNYFFCIFEQKVLELSAVLWGSNPYTPVAEGKKSAGSDSLNNTHLREQRKQFYLTSLQHEQKT